MYISDTTYQGEEKLVISIDIGTTFSAVTFCHVYAGAKPEVRAVLKWPGQEDTAGDSKIPSLLAYQAGEVRFCGAEALEYLDDDDYEIARWFKVHLHPESMRTLEQPPAYGSPIDAMSTIELPPLPEGVTLEQIYTDFIRYLYSAAHSYFIRRTPDGRNIWNRLQERTIIILCTPNSWDIAQHTFMRQVAVDAGLVTESDVDDRLEFITEGEASIHFALAHAGGLNWLQAGAMFAVTDAGGSTVDSTLYECKSTEPLILQEACASECALAGGVFVDRAAYTLLKDRLFHTRYGSEEWVMASMRAFEKKTKRVFDGSQESNVVAFGGPGDTDRNHGIVKGKLFLSRNEVSRTFEDVVARTVESCSKLLRGRRVQHLLLVGGFAESPFLRARLAFILHNQGTEVVTVDEPSKKAAAEGATIWFLKQLVKARAARCTYGMHAWKVFRRTIHSEREADARVRPDGTKKIRVFDPVVEKESILTNDWEKSIRYQTSYTTFPLDLERFSRNLYTWEGEGKSVWLRDQQGNLLPGMRHLCALMADLSGLKGSLTRHRSAYYEYWRLDYEVVISFKRGKLQAKLRWTENGVKREGPVTILPEATF
ncbi:hypothetical protein M408DRAFT_331406 [Serendipita vermifera MAFF 305830]|uniref:Uncharacterized protein n=1 Tax=Serendipita vermifera MAFF 305830 TaxID=933852 RepID=A0A0C2X786_SERVB|nr:hypothetical protein M408DRAFT_331406 [Serendipita vermifera MAFF 305830]